MKPECRSSGGGHFEYTGLIEAIDRHVEVLKVQLPSRIGSGDRDRLPRAVRGDGLRDIEQGVGHHPLVVSLANTQAPLFLVGLGVATASKA